MLEATSITELNDKPKYHYMLSKYRVYRFNLIVAISGATVVYADGSFPLYWWYLDDNISPVQVFSIDNNGVKYKHYYQNGTTINNPTKDLYIKCT